MNRNFPEGLLVEDDDGQDDGISLMKVEVIAIRTEADYETAREFLSSLMNARTAAEGVRLRAQAAIIAAYEAGVVPPRAVDPVEAIKFRMEWG
jgi:antitoxin component HigA of HigAB toxin-antitoxin module